MDKIELDSGPLVALCAMDSGVIIFEKLNLGMIITKTNISAQLLR